MVRPLQVKEGGVRDLTPSLLNAWDLDVPSDILTFTVLEPPTHGNLVKIGGKGAELPERRSLQVSSFSLEELQQGETLANSSTLTHNKEKRAGLHIGEEGRRMRERADLGGCWQEMMPLLASGPFASFQPAPAH